MENASNEENSKFRTYRIHPGTGFILGFIAAILLGSVISIKKLPQQAQEIIYGLLPIPQVNGWYYYVTSTNESHYPIRVSCKGSSETEKIAGVVEIDHSPNIANYGSNISFKNGERIYCLQKKGKMEKLTPVLNWESEWAAINGMKIYGYFDLKTSLHGLLNAEISSNLSKDNFFFRGPLVYVPDPHLRQSPFYTTIEFTRCPSRGECYEKLDSKLKMLGLL